MSRRRDDYYLSGHGPDHPPACTCVVCETARRSEFSHKVWRGQRRGPGHGQRRGPWRLIRRLTWRILFLLLLVSAAATFLAGFVHVRRGVSVNDLPHVLAVDLQVLRACPDWPSDIWRFFNRTSGFEQTGAAAANAVCVEQTYTREMNPDEGSDAPGSMPTATPVPEPTSVYRQHIWDS